MSGKGEFIHGGFLDDFDGETIERTEDLTSSQASAELLYTPSESIFGILADDLVSLGWSVFPQEVDRKPGRINHETINWQKDHHLSEQLPSKHALEEWKKYCAHLNVACVMGAGSSNAFALDIDVLDETLSRKVVELADEMLGYSPFRRVGNHPKIALIYRTPDGEVMGSTQRFFVDLDENGNPIKTDNLLEVVGSAKPMTFHGIHHKTGRYFMWLDATPLSFGPDSAPIVSHERLQDFLERVDRDIKPFHRATSISTEPTQWEWDENRNIYTPGKISPSDGLAPWVEDEEGIVIDGREAYLTSITMQIARLNPGLPAEQLGHIVADHFSSTAKTSGRWTGQRLLREAIGKAKRLVGKIEAGELSISRKRPPGAFPRRVDSEIFPKSAIHVEDTHLEECGLEFLKNKKPIPFPVKITDETNDVRVSEEERLEKVDEVQKGMQRSLKDFFSDVVKKSRDGLRSAGEYPPLLTGDDAKIFADVDKKEKTNDLHLVRAPTGSGKTSQTINFIAKHRKALFPTRDTGKIDFNSDAIYEPLELYETENGSRHRGTRPIVFLLPTYENIDELEKRVQGLNLGGTAEEIKQAALDLGLIPEDKIEERLGDLQRQAMNAGLKAMVYRGKIAAGCQMKEKVELAQSAGINSSSFCHAVKKTADGETEDVYCEFYDTCAAIQQKKAIQQSHVVFMPHAFMNLNIPNELKEVKAVIADERIHHLFLHTTTFPVSSLMIARKPPRLTKKEKLQGVLAEDIMQDRHEAVEIVLDALKRNICPATALYNAKDSNNQGQGHYGFDIVKSALRVSGGGLKRDADITPETPVAELKNICSRPTGLDVSEEYRLWKIVEDRMHLLSHDNLLKGEIASIEKELETFSGEYEPDIRERLENKLNKLKTLPFNAKGMRDMRIQFLRPHGEDNTVREIIRLSWRTEPNWIDNPMLLLDASAAPEIIGKIWNNKTPKVHDIDGPLHVRVVGVVDQTFSNASLVGKPGDSQHERARVARRLNKVRKALSAVSSYYGWGRVVAGSSIIVRKAVNANWEGPHNVDWCHYGAMRGLDFAKFHSAAFSVGRMEVPIHAIDGLVAALTYDDENPEDPFDKDGTGRDKGDRPLMLPISTQKLRMRDGRVVEVPAPMYPGAWGRLMQKQYREEELNQFVGRLRPVYREGEAPVWFALSSVIPENYIVDHLVHIDTLINGSDRYWDAIRKCGSIIEPNILHAVNPDVFSSIEDAKRRMTDIGFNFENGEIDHPTASAAWRRTKGFISLRYKIENDPHRYRYAYVLAVAEDHEQLLKERLEEVLDVSVFGVERCSQGPGRTRAYPRTPDKIDLELGDLLKRKTLENKVGEDASVYVFEEGLNRVETRSGLPYPLQFRFNRSPNMGYSDFEAMKSIENLWVKLQYEDSIRHPMLVGSESGEAFDHLGGHLESDVISELIDE